MIVATSGHVDHGKTLLVHALTGIETDKLEEEKTRGLTIDLGFAYVHKQTHSIGFIDVPGHIKFINNMLAGVSSIDMGMLVIAADDGPMPQTLEHLAILNILAIPAACIVLTKIDRVDAKRIETVKVEIKKLLASTNLSDAPFFEVSSTTGAGLEKLKSFLWQASIDIDSITNDINVRHTNSTQSNFRLAIDRCFSVKGSGLVVTGSVFSGTIEIGDEVYLMPANTTVRVRGIHRQNETSSSGRTGDRLAINLSGDISRHIVSRGHWLSKSNKLPFTSRFDMSMQLLASESKPLKNGTPVHVHAAAQHTTGRIATLESHLIEPGTKQLVQVILSQTISVCYSDQIIIRDQSASRTLGGGMVIDPFAPAKGRSKTGRVEYLKHMLNQDFDGRISKLLASNGFIAHADNLISTFNFKTINYEDFGELDSKRNLFSHKLIQTAEGIILSSLEKWHKNLPTGNSPTEIQLSNLSGLALPLLRFSLEKLTLDHKVKIEGQRIRLVDHEKKIAGQELVLWQAIEPMLKVDIMRPPVVHDLAKNLRMQAKDLDKQLKPLIGYGLLVKPVKNRYFLPHAIQALKEIAIKTAQAQAKKQFTVIQFRDESGLGRNLCIELLEYFDSIGFTRRLDDNRIIQNKNR